MLRENSIDGIGRNIVLLLVSLLVMAGIYVGTTTFMGEVMRHPEFSGHLLTRLLDICFVAFFLLLLFSNSIAALGYLYASNDINLLLSLPVSSARLYLARLVEIMLTSSWMFLVFAVPAVLGFASASNLSWDFLLVGVLATIPFIVIPAAIGSILVTLFVNLVPPHRIRDILIILAFLLVCVILFLNNDSRALISTDQQKLNEMIGFLSADQGPPPIWSPSRWLVDILNTFINPERGALLLPFALLYGSASSLTLIGMYCFVRWFHRGWGLSQHGSKRQKMYGSNFSEKLGRMLIPFSPQLRAICYKEARMFMRDSTQSLQLLMLLMLTFIYLYNFRALRVGANLPMETLYWWQVLLAIANVSFGTCVVSAIATRFVFPSISLEGRAYAVVRSTPLSIEQLLRNKFYTWFMPTASLSIILLVSGAWAIQASSDTVIATGMLATAVSISLVGIAIGVGAVYARFDWESPAQVTASFGSLVYMLLSLSAVAVTLVPSAIVFILTSVPSFRLQMGETRYWIALSGSFILIFYINYIASRYALKVGANHLKDLEA
jgi:ABC-2 type transport system permease protein